MIGSSCIHSYIYINFFFKTTNERKSYIKKIMWLIFPDRLMLYFMNKLLVVGEESVTVACQNFIRRCLPCVMCQSIFYQFFFFVFLDYLLLLLGDSIQKYNKNISIFCCANIILLSHIGQFQCFCWFDWECTCLQIFFLYWRWWKDTILI